MKSHYLSPLFVLIILNLVACSKKETVSNQPENPFLPPVVVTTSKSYKIDSIKQSLISNGYTITNTSVNNDSTEVTFNYKETLKGSDEYAIPDLLGAQPNTPKEIFLGSFLNAKSFLKSTDYYLHPNAIKQISGSTAKANIYFANGKYLNTYSLTSVGNDRTNNDVYNTINSQSTTSINQSKGPLKVYTGTFKKLQEVKDKYLFEAKSNVLQFMMPTPHPPNEQSMDNEPIYSPSSVYIFFRQDFANEKIDSSTFSIDKKNIQDSNALYTQYDPAYISSITYGIFGLIVIESDQDATLLLAAVNTLINSDSTALTSAQKDLLNNSIVRTTYRTYDNIAPEVIGVNKITAMKNYFENYAEIQNTKKSYPATYFTIKRVKDNQAISNAIINSSATFNLL